jgi:type IV pilus assembly protein PilA
MPRLFRKFIKSFKYGQKGFTLIELLIVIAILGILAAVAIPQLVKFVGQSKVSAANAELGMVNSSMAAGMTDAQVSTLPGPGGSSPVTGPLNKSTDFIISTVSANYTVGGYVQGGNASLVGAYTFDSSGKVIGATYNGLTASGTPFKY